MQTLWCKFVAFHVHLMTSQNERIFQGTEIKLRNKTKWWANKINLTIIIHFQQIINLTITCIIHFQQIICTCMCILETGRSLVGSHISAPTGVPSSTTTIRLMLPVLLFNLVTVLLVNDATYTNSWKDKSFYESADIYAVTFTLWNTNSITCKKKKKKLRLHLEINAQAPKGISQQYKLKRNIFIEILQLSWFTVS